VRGHRLKVVFQLVGIGWYVGLCIVLGIGSGLWIDRSVGTLPLFAILGLLLGLLVAFYGMYRMVVLVVQSLDEEHSTKEDLRK
jgi:ATP synthase protein I